MKISIITVGFNCKNTLEDCIKSVLSQNYPDVEYIIIDGGSTDGTLDVIKKYKNDIAYFVSEPDKGIYDAMNKGIKAATGDIIGILNSDDVYADNEILQSVAACIFEKKVDSCYGDLFYVTANDMDRKVRYWKAGSFNKNNFIRGWMPPHPTFFVRRSVYEQFGLFNLNFPLAADYELMLRFLYKYDVSTYYIPQCLVRMRTGGACKPGLLNTFNNMIENYRAWRVNDLKPNPLTFIMKPLHKTSQFLKIKTC
jgi:glycosyltransferase